MGADFTYSLCHRAVDKDTALRRILEMTDNHLRQVMIDMGDDFDYDDYDTDDDIATDTTVTAEMLAAYRDTLVMDLECVYGGYRDTAILLIGGETYILTGGMSWGDEPTDSYRSLWRIAESMVTATEGEWRKSIILNETAGK